MHRMKKMIKKIREDNERGARQNLMEELFYDFNRNRHQVYLMNFTRGLFFGFGSVIGGTIVVGLVVWILGQFTGIFPPLADFFNALIAAMRHGGK